MNKRKNMPGYTQKRDSAGRMQWMRDGSKADGSKTDDINATSDFLHNHDMLPQEQRAWNAAQSTRAFMRQKAAREGSDEVREYLANDKDKHVRAAVATYGNDDMRDYLLDDDESLVRSAIAMKGSDEQKKILSEDKNVIVRGTVAQYSTGALREKMLNDNSDYVCAQAVEGIYKEQGDKGIVQYCNDPRDTVRAAVAKNCSYDMKMKFLDDDSPKVRAAVASSSNDDIRWHLMNDTSDMVRGAVAYHGSDDMRQQMSNNDNDISALIEKYATEEWEE